MPEKRPRSLHREIVVGTPCLFLAHGRNQQDVRAFRYRDTGACVECIKNLTRPGLTLDVNAIRPSMRFHYLDFWSLVDIGDPDRCWEAPVPTLGMPHRFHEIHTPAWILESAKTVSVGRLAFWFSWGDIGTIPIRRICANRRCCNPLHLRASWVPHLHYLNRLDGVDFAIRTSTHKHNVNQYLRDRLKEMPASYGRLSEIAPDLIERLRRHGLPEAIKPPSQSRPPETSA